MQKTPYQQLIDYIDTILTDYNYYNCSKVYIKINVKGFKDNVKLSQDGVNNFKTKLREKKDKSQYGEKDKIFNLILENLKKKLAEKEIAKYCEKIGLEGNFNFDEAIKSDNLLCLKHYLESIGNYSGLRKVYEKLLSYKKDFDIDEFERFLAYQKGRGIIKGSGRDFYQICHLVLKNLQKQEKENKYNYEKFKKWFQSILAYYVYYKGTKN